jgi:radical SAM superfamily enzyme YgiQ (UPF0313 family)
MPAPSPRNCHKLGITIHGTFIVGLPGETKDTIQETIQFAQEMNPHTIQVSLAATYPGTYLYRQAQENGWLRGDSEGLVAHSGVQVSSLNYPHLSHEEIFEAVSRVLPALLLPAAQALGNDERNVFQRRHVQAPLPRGRRVLPLPAVARKSRRSRRGSVIRLAFRLARERKR